MSKETELSCKNVFKCKDKAAMKKAFNEKWIGLINQLEKSKRTGLICEMINAKPKSRHLLPFIRRGQEQSA